VSEPHLLQDLLLIFGLGVIVVVAFHRLRLPPIVGFLFTGALCGPFGFGLVDGVHNVEALAEVGVVLLLFTVGIEFSVEELSRVRTFCSRGARFRSR
jgi:CPA2 family monovalent cation:H+ antiporter-2